MAKKLKEPANAEADPSENGDGNEAQRFEELTRRLVRVPKSEIDKRAAIYEKRKQNGGQRSA